MPVNSIVQTVLFSCLLLVASLWDIRERIIPDAICVAVALVGLLTFHPSKLLGILLGLPFLIAALVKDGGMGGGDIKLTAACGFVLGISVGSLGLTTGLFAALAWHIVMNGILKLKQIPVSAAESTVLPLAPFLSIGFITAAMLKLGGSLLSMI